MSQPVKTSRWEVQNGSGSAAFGVRTRRYGLEVVSIVHVGRRTEAMSKRLENTKSVSTVQGVKDMWMNPHVCYSSNRFAISGGVSYFWKAENGELAGIK